jgi:hypothetical protein
MNGACSADLTDSLCSILFGFAKVLGVITIMAADEDFYIGLATYMGLTVYYCNAGSFFPICVL